MGSVIVPKGLSFADDSPCGFMGLQPAGVLFRVSVNRITMNGDCINLLLPII